MDTKAMTEPNADSSKNISPSGQVFYKMTEVLQPSRDAMSADVRRTLGRPSTLRDSLAVFIAALKANPDAAADLWQAEWDKVMISKTPASRASYTSKYRGAIATELGADHPALAVVKVLARESSEPLRTVDTRDYGGRRPARQDRIERFIEFAQKAFEARVAADEAAHTEHAADETAAAARDKPRSVAAARRSAAKKRDDAIARNAEGLETMLTALWAEELSSMSQLKPGSIKGSTVHYRNALRTAGLSESALAKILSIVTVPLETQRQVATAYQDRIVARNHALVAVPRWRDLLDVAIEALPEAPPPGLWETMDNEAIALGRRLDRPDLVRIGVALGLVTGRRPFEVFVTGAVSPSPLENGKGVDLWRVLFHGQAKTKQRDDSAFDQTFPIPILAKAKHVVFAWKVLRLSSFGQTWEKMSNEEFANDLLRAPGVQCIWPIIRDEMFAGLWPSIDDDDDEHARDAKIVKSFNIRALYAEIADNFFRPPHVSKTAFFSTILGHTLKDIETAQSYMKYHLPDEKGTGPTRGVKTRLTRKIAASAAERAGEEPV